MELRKRVKLRKLQHTLGLSQDAAAAGRCSSNIWGAGRSNASQRGTGEGYLLGGSGACSGLEILPWWPWRQCVSMAAGLLLAGLLALAQAWCVNAIHENLLWFSQLTEVEREISFRTECLSDLIHDNLTESKRTINLLQRMNIYQEVFLSVLYRLLPIQSYLEPVYFYIYTVFSLQAVYVIALYLTAWLLSGSWLAGTLTGVWYILNRVDTTRVEFTISLRENWSMPFLALQVTAITCYLRPQLTDLQQKVMVWLMYVTTFCFCLTWQFNQFILLVQALIIYSLDCLDFLTTTQVTTLYLVQVSSLLSVWLLQFCNSMILGSLVLSFIVAALFIRHCQPGLKTGSPLVRLGRLLLHSAMVLLLTVTINYLAKAFGLLPFDTLERLAGTLLLYPYILTLLLLSGTLAVAALHNLRVKGGAAEERKGAVEGRAGALRPDVAYNLLHTLFYGLLAFSTMRMKYIWTGHMCAVAAYGVCGKELWTLLLSTLRCNSKVLVRDLTYCSLSALNTRFLSLILQLRLVRYAVPLLVIACLYYKFWPKLMEELSELREFYDPDTVELMTWI
ncbi:hypothetical protein F7725_026846, partial [Dissostichus mawsoni]